jgi:3-phosphoshikimate 1-carboxyvinyltransferase
VGEPTARIRVRSSALRAIDIDASDVAAAIDEIPVLCLAATQATGTTRIRDAGELRVKESDRLTGIAEGLAAFGARVTVDGDTISITGPSRLHGAQPDSRLDHRLAMTFAIAALVADGASSIGDAESVAISYPTFFADLEGVVS